MSAAYDVEEGAAQLYEEWRTAQCSTRIWFEVPENEREAWRSVARDVDQIVESAVAGLTETPECDHDEDQIEAAERKIDDLEAALEACVASMMDMIPIVKRSRGTDRDSILARAQRTLVEAGKVRS